MYIYYIHTTEARGEYVIDSKKGKKGWGKCLVSALCLYFSLCFLSTAVSSPSTLNRLSKSCVIKMKRPDGELWPIVIILVTDLTHRWDLVRVEETKEA